MDDGMTGSPAIRIEIEEVFLLFLAAEMQSDRLAPGEIGRPVR